MSLGMLIKTQARVQTFTSIPLVFVRTGTNDTQAFLCTFGAIFTRVRITVVEV